MPHSTLTPNTTPLAPFDFSTKADASRALVALLDPLAPHLSRAGARLRLPGAAAHYGSDAAEMEGVTRALWGLAPLLAGGGGWDHADRLLAGLHAGADPDHPEYWGEPGDFDQRWVEAAAIGVALLLIPDRIAAAGDDPSLARLARWLGRVNRCELHPNNWRYFRVLINLALRRIDQPFDANAARDDLALIDTFAEPEGWYTDGCTRQMDYYVPWAMHFYGMLVASLAPDFDAGFTERAKQRAADFAPSFAHWFAQDGAAIPFGRSLTYRFAQAAFWAAAPFIDGDAADAARARRLWTNGLRWWRHKPIAHADGTLSVGYAYRTDFISEEYNAPGSPYWAFKAFLPLALPSDHTFWNTDAESKPPRDGRSVQRPAGVVIERADGHAVALVSGNFSDKPHRVAAAKYGKFAYASAFGFSVPSAQDHAAALAPDSVLALSEDGRDWRTRGVQERAGVTADGVLWSVWTPWPDVMVRTWLASRGAWHVRLHTIETARTIRTVEGAFAVPSAGSRTPIEGTAQTGVASATAHGLSSAVRSLIGDRDARVLRTFPNTNVLFPLAVLPILESTLEPGTHDLACAVLGSAGPAGAAQQPPTITPRTDGWDVVFADGSAAAIGPRVVRDDDAL